MCDFQELYRYLIDDFVIDYCKTVKASDFVLKDEVYLVTCKHVIYGEKYSENPDLEADELKLNLHTNLQDFSQNEEVTLNLLDGNKKKWLEHRDPSVDIILVPVNLDSAKYVFRVINTSLFDKENTIAVFEKIFVIGYPQAWYDRLNNLPIVRVGNLSSPYKNPFCGEKYMLGDVVSQPGMSGGPVLMDLFPRTVRQPDGSRMIHIDQRKFVFLGLNSGSPELPNGERSGLIAIWFPELILEIIKNK